MLYQSNNPELKDELQRIWTVLLQKKSIAKGVKNFPKRLEANISVMDDSST